MIDAHLKKAGLLFLQMQSATGELAYGGRSNQFIHNEAWLAAILEFEANRYAREGDLCLASTFKQARDRAVEAAELWLSKEPIRHIKNRFPTETKYGCEDYAYFDKYMITAASFFYSAYQMCDDSIPVSGVEDGAPAVCQTSEYFHKLFLKCGEYSAQLDTSADPHYDASGLGRLHRKGAPSAIALSLPCPSKPEYILNLPDAMELSVCPGVWKDGAWVFATGEGAQYRCEELETSESAAWTELCCRIGDQSVKVKYTLDTDGLGIEINGEGKLACLIPAFFFDGETYTDIHTEKGSLTVSYEGWQCRYTTDGQIRDLEKLGGNRNGHYKAFCAAGENTFRVWVEICEEA